MAEANEPNESINHSNTLLIVVGAHLRAEVADRPLGYELQQRVNEWLEEHQEQMNVSIDVIVCSDIWYLNNEQLQQCPTISIGGPGVNALSAYFAQNLKHDTGQEQQVLIQIDPEYTDLRVCIWGTNHELTVKGLDLFNRQYLDGYLRAVVTQVEPHAD